MRILAEAAFVEWLTEGVRAKVRVYRPDRPEIDEVVVMKIGLSGYEPIGELDRDLTLAARSCMARAEGRRLGGLDSHQELGYA